MSKYSKIKSYMLYAQRSLRVNSKSYITLFLSIVFMVIMSGNVLIYNVSKSNGDDELLRVQYGNYHALFKEVDNISSTYLDNKSYIKKSLNIDVYSTIINSNKDSEILTAYFAEYNDNIGNDLYIEMISGEYPSYNEIMLSDTFAGAFQAYTGDTVTYTLKIGARVVVRSFYVSGVFKGSEPSDKYIFANSETIDDIISFDTYATYNTVDKYVTFESSSLAGIKKGIIKVTDELGIEFGSENFESRSEYLNAPVCELLPFYEKPEFLLTLLMSILPCLVAVLVFIILDIYGSMKELSALSMIGTTSKQVFKMLALKYAILYIGTFPCGMAASAFFMKLLCVFCNNMNNSEKIYLKYSVDTVTVLCVFIICLALLVTLTYLASKKMTSGTYTDMMSMSVNTENVFVRKTSNLFMCSKYIKRKTGAMFFVRNRSINMLYCIVIGIMIMIFTYFTLVMTQEIGNIPLSVDRSDVKIIGDESKGYQYGVISENTINKIKSFDNVQRIMKSYSVTSFYEGVEPSAYLLPNKKIVEKTSTIYGNISKSFDTDTIIFAEEYDQAQLVYGQYVVDGDLKNLYDGSGKIALFVHTYGEDKEYYHAGDKVYLMLAYEYDEKTQTMIEGENLKVYEIGAVLYDRFDEYATVNVVRILTSPEGFSEMTYIDYCASLDIVLNNDSDTEVDKIIKQLQVLAKTDNIKFENTRKAFLQEKVQMYTSLCFYTVLWISLLIIIVMMLVSLTYYLAKLRNSSAYTLYQIGTQRKELYKIFGFEYALSSICSVAAGVILSIFIVIIYAMSVRIIFNAYIGAILLMSTIFICSMAIIIPLFCSQRYFMKEKYKTK